MSSPYYVDEATGSDDTGKGTQELPYQSIAFALFAHGHESKVLSRKDASATYEEPTQSALKKAKKGADGLEKKRKKNVPLQNCSTLPPCVIALSQCYKKNWHMICKLIAHHLLSPFSFS